MLDSVKKYPYERFEKKGEPYLKTVQSLVQYYKEKGKIDLCINLWEEMIKTYPKYVDSKIYGKVIDFIHYWNEKANEKAEDPNIYIEKIDDLNTFLLKKAKKDVRFQILLKLERYEESCELLDSFPSDYYYSSHYSESNSKNLQWKSITQLFPYLSKISRETKLKMIELLEKQFIKKLENKKSRNRPDAIIAQQIKDMKAIYLSLQKSTNNPKNSNKKNVQTGKEIWNIWFSKFSSKYWRLRNLRAALSNVNLEMKK